jgi:hypothetical protein
MKPTLPSGLLLSVLLATLLAGCATPPAPVTAAAPPAPVLVPPAPPPLPSLVSLADNQADYRLDAASHLYDMNSARIFKGVLPHFLYAIGVVQVQVDGKGQLTGLNWLRAPVHAPEVIAEIERTVRRAAPFPAPVHMGSATYIETWLWDASGNFQLHTLSEGQGVPGTPPRMHNGRPLRLVAAH